MRVMLHPRKAQIPGADSHDSLRALTPHHATASTAIETQAPETISKRILDRLLMLHDRDADKHAARIIKCTDGEHHWCHDPFHALCQARIAKRKRRQIERVLRSLPASSRMVHLTLELGCDDIEQGRKVLVDSFAAIRRSLNWKDNVDFGCAGIEVMPAQGRMRSWNVHAHVLTVLRPGSSPDFVQLHDTFVSLVTAHGLAGQSHVTHSDRRFVPGRRGAWFCAAGLLRHQTQTLRLAGREHDQRPMATARPGDSGQALGPSLRSLAEGVHMMADCAAAIGLRTRFGLGHAPEVVQGLRRPYRGNAGHSPNRFGAMRDAA